MINFIVFDFDGVFTDGKIFYLSNGEQLKYYNVKDGLSIKLLKNKNILSGLISSHDSISTQYIARHLNFDYVSIGSKYSKYNILNQWKNELNIQYNEIAYIGDDLPDYDCLKTVGISACPQDAVDEIKKICSYVCKNKGGEGCVREFVEYIINVFVK